MHFFADLHIHSKYSRACSKALTFPQIYKWCQFKGIKVIATADFTHPAWISEIEKYLDETDVGLFKLKEEYAKEVDNEIPPSCRSDVYFILSVEISLIYKRKDKVRKTHHVILVPDLKTAKKLISKLDTIGNLKSDGRPILGLSSRDLLEITLEINKENLLIPAHIWTPWFSIFGAKSGYDCLEDCFDVLKDHIYAIETGLSSDPKMNWMVKDLDNVAIISNSDAHSPKKIAREANVFNCRLSYNEITQAIKTNDKRLIGTVEFFPEEGKYHHDGHRACNVNFSPKETKKHNSICPKCNKKLTIGVLNQVCALAKSTKPRKHSGSKPFKYLIPLHEILSEILGVGVNTKTVEEEYFKLLSKFGNELKITLDIPRQKLYSHSPILAEGIMRMREGNINIIPGYDGVFGEISLFEDNEVKKLEGNSQIKFL